MCMAIGLHTKYIAAWTNQLTYLSAVSSSLLIKQGKLINGPCFLFPRKQPKRSHDIENAMWLVETFPARFQNGTEAEEMYVPRPSASRARTAYVTFEPMSASYLTRVQRSRMRCARDWQTAWERGYVWGRSWSVYWTVDDSLTRLVEYEY